MDLQSLMWTIVGILAGVIASYNYYKRALRDREPTALLRSNNLIEGNTSKFENLKIEYKGHEVKNLTVSKLAFWNNGKQTIKRDDIPDKAQIFIVGKGDTVILEVQVVAQTNSENDFGALLLEDGKRAKVDFSFLDHHQGGIIQIVHTGLNSQDLDLAGTVIGFGKVKVMISPFEEGITAQKPRRHRSEGSSGFIIGFMLFWGAIIFLPGLIFSLLMSFNPSETITVIQKNENGTLWSSLVFLFIGPVFLIMGSMLLYSAFRIWRRRPPKELNILDR
jgi:hypothetical protein